MKRDKHTDRQDQFETLKTRGRSRRRPFLLISLLMCAVCVAVLPRILINRSIALGIIERLGTLKPLRIDMATVSAGWFSPASVTGLKIGNEQGEVFAEIGAVNTNKGLLSWFVSGSDLGTIQLRDIVVDIEAHEGSTNIERSLQTFLSSSTATQASEQPSQPVAPVDIKGRIEVESARIRLRNRESTESWLVAIERMALAVPRAGQLAGPIQLQATVQSLKPGEKLAGAINAELTEADFGGTQGLALRVGANTLPLELWQAISARLPDVPVRKLAGSVSGQFAASYVDLSHWSVDLPQVVARNFHLHAPEFVGDKAVQLNEVALLGRCSLDSNSLVLEKVNLTCDAGKLDATARLPWPLVLPSLTQPWMPQAVVDATGSIDLQRLAAAAQSLIPMKEGMQLDSGKATFRIAQSSDARNQPRSQLELTLADLSAMTGGQRLVWSEPLKISASVEPQEGGLLLYSSRVVSEFCDMTGNGHIQQGKFAGDVNLDRLQQKVAQWIDLPMRAMSGSAKFDLNWNQVGAGVVKVDGSVSTTPLAMSFAGGELREPAWQGTIDATARLNGAQLTEIGQSQLVMRADQEALHFELLEPLSLTAAGSAPTSVVRPAFKTTLTGDIANWQRRAAVFQIALPDTQVSGKVELQIGGRLNLAQMELNEAAWKFEPFEVSMPQLTLAEPQLVGTFKGRIDTSDLTRLAVEKLEVRATAFSLGAADSPTANSKEGRTGRAAFLVDLGRLMNNVSTDARRDAVALPSATQSAGKAALVSLPSQQRLVMSGRVQGDLAWQINSQEAAFNLKTNGENIEAANQPVATAGTVAPKVRLWAEPKLVSTIEGTWHAASSAVRLHKLELQAPWVNMVGVLDYSTSANIQTAIFKGQCLYDAAQVGQKLQPWVGDYVQLVGQKTVPIEVKWTSNTGKQSSLAGLQASTRIGWEQARVVGIQVGNADVPVSITNGLLATAAEIPVSGGVLRWDVTGDLTSENMLLTQKPMTVLDNVAITPEMCESWLKYVAPLLAQATSVEGRLSMKLNEAQLNPVNPRSQLVDGQLIMHNAQVGPGPLSNQIIGVVQQVNAIRKQDFSQLAGNQQTWLKMPQQDINFRMENGQVAHKDLNVQIGDANLRTSGAVDIDGRMNLLAEMPVPDDWVEKSPLLASLRGKSLQFPVRGTLSGPQMDTQLLTQIGRDTVQQAAQGLIQRELQRGLGKLFGAPPAPQGTPNQ